jgi:hypothetical protein
MNLGPGVYTPNGGVAQARARRAPAAEILSAAARRISRTKVEGPQILSNLRVMPRASLRCSSVYVGKQANPANVDFLFALAGLGDIVRGLHPHERVHLYSECLFNAEAMSPERFALLLSRLDRAGRDT